MLFLFLFRSLYSGHLSLCLITHLQHFLLSILQSIVNPFCITSLYSPFRSSFVCLSLPSAVIVGFRSIGASARTPDAMGVPPRGQKGARSKKPQRRKESVASSLQEGGPKESKEAILPRLEPAVAEYFRRAHETLKSGFDSEEEKGKTLWRVGVGIGERGVSF